MKENNISRSQIKKNATLYAKEAVARWKNFVSLNIVKASEIAQELNNFHAYELRTSNDRGDPVSEANELVVRHRKHWTKTL